MTVFLTGGFASVLAPRGGNVEKRSDTSLMELVKRADFLIPTCASLKCPRITPFVYNTAGCTMTTCMTSTTTTTSAVPVLAGGVCGDRVAADPPLTLSGCPDVDYLCTTTRYTGVTQCPPIPCTSTSLPTVYSTVTTTVYVPTALEPSGPAFTGSTRTDSTFGTTTITSSSTGTITVRMSDDTSASNTSNTSRTSSIASASGTSNTSSTSTSTTTDASTMTVLAEF